MSSSLPELVDHIVNPHALVLDGTKVGWYPERIAAWERGEKIAPITMDVAWTRKCNYACEFCVAGTTKILMADYTWKSIRDVVVGDRVVGFDEHKSRDGHHARYFPTTVTAVMTRRGSTYEVAAKESALRITLNHQMLCQGHRWRAPERFTQASVRFFGPAYETDFRETFEYKLGYLKGALEGDGSFGVYRDARHGRHGEMAKFKLQANDPEMVDRCAKYIRDLFGLTVWRPRDQRIITLSQRDAVIDLRAAIGWKSVEQMTFQKARGYLAGIFDAEGSLSVSLRIANIVDRDSVGANIRHALVVCGFEYREETKGVRLLGGFRAISRFLGVTRPAIVRKVRALDGGAIPETVRALKGQRLAYEQVHNLETESHTYVANGFAVHNCYAQMQASKGQEITREIALQFLDDAAEIGVKGVSLISDGESSIVPFYAESIIHGAKAGLQIGIGTNGRMLHKPMLEQILPHLSYLRFNFSGGTREGYARIMGVKPEWYDEVIQNVKDAMEIKRRDRLGVTINMQLVCEPKYEPELVPFVELAQRLRPDYAIIKHCADDVDGTLGIDYSLYPALEATFAKVEAMGDKDFRVVVKRDRLKNGGRRDYSKCYGPPFILQMSGNGLIAPCGFLFNEKYKAFHIGNICEERFKDIYQSDRYWEVIRYLGSDEFDPRSRCGPNCLQTQTNAFLFKLKNGEVALPVGAPPPHLGFL